MFLFTFCFALKNRCAVLEEVIVDLVMDAMETCEVGTSLENMRRLWQRLSGMAISYILFGVANFAPIVAALCNKVMK